jgi:predicted acylesterase/phospholipase RssA
MARLITGKAIGLVLGGGGARGLAHIGVLRAIQEAGLEIDLVGGNSIGAVVAAGFALGMDWQEIAEACKQWAHKNELIDYTFPALSLMAGKRFTAKLREAFNRKRIEDTWIEYFCVSANLNRAKQVVHRRGELWKYIRASSAVFPIFPPVTDHGDLLVDGVLVNNLPIEVMRNICEDCTIIGVDISVESPLQDGYDFEPTLSGWEVLLKKLNPFQPDMDIPGFVNLFMRINEFSSVRQKFRQYDITDYIIRPDIEEIGLFQFEDFDEIVELGYQAGKQALEKWRGQLWQK